MQNGHGSHVSPFYKTLLTNILCGYIRFHNEGAHPSRNAVVNEIMRVEEI